MRKAGPGRVPQTYTCGGKTMTIKQWVDALNVKHGTLYRRLRSMPAEQALSIPRQSHNNRVRGQHLEWITPGAGGRSNTLENA